MTEVTAIFDIGKTNKKFFLFNSNFEVVFKQESVFAEVEDEDGFPTEDLSAVVDWIRRIFDQARKDQRFQIKALNFSTYGASLVHLDREGSPLTVLYNYTKDFPNELKAKFLEDYGPLERFESETAARFDGFLNSGMQLYWLKYKRPNIFKKVETSLHLPQYLSYLFTGIPTSDYTSVGCHTGLWDFQKGTYHPWVYEEGLDALLPKLETADHSMTEDYQGVNLNVGIGVHDSSAAILPYSMSQQSDFVLLSTGTWSVAINPGNHHALSSADVERNTLNYMRVDGKRVRARRLFLGNEYKVQVDKLNVYFNEEDSHHKEMRFSEEIYQHLRDMDRKYFVFESIKRKDELPSPSFHELDSFEIAYHQLMIELMELQVEALHAVIGEQRIEKIYIDGGFADNDLFTGMLCLHFPRMAINIAHSPLGSALGAALLISNFELPTDFLQEQYKLKDARL